MPKYNVGDKVRVLNADEIIGGNEHWNNGDIVTVTEIDDNRTWLTRTKTEETFRHPFLHERELKYVELVSRKPRKSERISALETEVAELKAEVESLKQVSKPTVHNVTFSPAINAGISTEEIASNIKKAMAKLSSEFQQPRSLTPNERRADVIKRAKAFVSDWEVKCGRKISYVVNAEKRTVVALKHRMFFGYEGGVIGRGIAKCDPADVFNADIGKAIALARALGVDVPEEFVKAVQPTEIAVGQRIYYTRNFPSLTVIESASKPRSQEISVRLAREYESSNRILEDTDAVYE